MKERLESLSDLNVKYRKINEAKLELATKFDLETKVQLDNFLTMKKANSLLSDMEKAIYQEATEKFIASFNNPELQELIREYLNLWQQEKELAFIITVQEQTDKVL